MNSARTDTFHYGDWLRPGQDTDRIELLPGSLPAKTVYKLALHTSDVRGAGTDANVRVTLFGILPDQSAVQFPASGQDGALLCCASDMAFAIVICVHHIHILCVPTCWLWLCCRARVTRPTRFVLRQAFATRVCLLLHTSLPGVRRPRRCAGFVLDDRRNNFERGACDEFFLEAGDLGELQKVLLCTDGAGIASDWHLRQVVVTNCTSQASTTFPFDAWFSSKAGLRHVRSCPRRFSRLRRLRRLWYTVPAAVVKACAAVSSVSNRVTSRIPACSASFDAVEMHTHARANMCRN